MVLPAKLGFALALALGLGPPPLDPPALGPSFGEAIPEHERASMRTAYADAIARACEGIRVCTEAPCDELGRIAVAIDGHSRSYALHWTIDDPRLAEPVIVERRCDLCSVSEVDEAIAAELGRSCMRLAALDQAPAQLQVDSAPVGAKLWIDGELAGRTPWAAELRAGVHELELRAPGHKPKRRTIELFAGDDRRARIELVPDAPPARSTRRPQAPGWVGVGLGLGLGIAGAVLLGIDGQPWRGRCSGADVDALGNCRFVYTTALLGAGLAIAGTGALGAGVGLVIWARRPSSRASSAGVALRLQF